MTDSAHLLAQGHRTALISRRTLPSHALTTVGVLLALNVVWTVATLYHHQRDRERHAERMAAIDSLRATLIEAGCIAPTIPTPSEGAA